MNDSVLQTAEQTHRVQGSLGNLPRLPPSTGRILMWAFLFVEVGGKAEFEPASTIHEGSSL